MYYLILIPEHTYYLATLHAIILHIQVVASIEQALLIDDLKALKETIYTKIAQELKVEPVSFDFYLLQSILITIDKYLAMAKYVYITT